MQPAQPQPQIFPWLGLIDGENKVQFLKEPIQVNGSKLDFFQKDMILVILKPVRVMGNINITAKKIIILADLTSTHNEIHLEAEERPIVIGAHLYASRGVFCNHCPLETLQNPLQNDIDSGLKGRNFHGIWKLVAEVARQIVARVKPQQGIILPQM